MFIPSRKIPALLSILLRSFSDHTKHLTHIPRRHRAATLSHARAALTEYLHVTRSLQFCHAESIAANSPSALSSLLSKFVLPDEPSEIPAALRRFLSFRPVNEFEFFFESIGLTGPVTGPVSGQVTGQVKFVFLSEDAALVSTVTALVQFGFPWTKLGVLFRECSSIFSKRPEEIGSLLSGYEDLGFPRVAVIGICLAFPRLLEEEISLFLENVKNLVNDFQAEGSAEENVDVYFRLGRRIRVFWDVGCRKGVGKLLAKNRNRLAEIEEEDLKRKIDFFCRLGMSGKEAGKFVLKCPEVLGFDLENTCLRIPDYLREFGFFEDVDFLCSEFPFVSGKNRLGNFPAILRAMDLSKSFVGRIQSESRFLFPDAEFEVQEDEDFMEEFEKVRRSARLKLVANKLEFLKEIGFGENKITLKTLRNLNSTKDQLKERFESLLQAGIDHSAACRMVIAAPKMMNQNAEMLRLKIDFLRNDIGCSLQYLNTFPAFLCFDLENRIKPRYRILDWLKKADLVKKTYSPGTIIATSEKRFVGLLREVHPAAPKLWLEVFSRKNS